MSLFPWESGYRYGAGLLRVYEHWVLGIQFCQTTLGSCVILAKRVGLERFSDLTPPELEELVRVMRHLETALEAHEAFRPDRFNYQQLGNELHHLHFHGIPRYAAPRQFAGREWDDPTYGNPPTWTEGDHSDEVIREIRDALEPYLPPA